MRKIIGILMLMGLLSCGTNDKIHADRLSFSNDKYYVYYNEEVIEIPKGTYITKDNKIDDYFFSFFGKHVKDEKKLLSDLSKYFPHGIKAIDTSKEVPSTSVEIPTMKLEDRNVIDSIRLANILSGGDGKALIVVDQTSDIVDVKETVALDPTTSLKGKSVTILNANGLNGSASKLGEKLKTELEIMYNAENYKERRKATYILNNKLTDEELVKLISVLGIKYVRLETKESNLYPESDAVVILGDDRKANLPIKIYSTTGVSELKEALKAYNPTVYKAKSGQGIVGITIKYSPEDIFIANKLSSLIPGSKLEKDENLKNKIEITTNR
ncbi:LytR C-terminal domain-containing protein [Oceanivirga salmonicida]|uniref:LytR C-terminal domain-containing protein n=1 Tax=Oceanivirga salmonicida TaxID=1769291 RepID=UPI0012E1A435|nr:LytR C-terminal domain-containing protein [Oceanivirga salmonicida]